MLHVVMQQHVCNIKINQKRYRQMYFTISLLIYFNITDMLLLLLLTPDNRTALPRTAARNEVTISATVSTLNAVCMDKIKTSNGS